MVFVSDPVLHYLLVGIGLGVGSFIKTLWDTLAERFWDKELDFRKREASLKE